VGDGQEFIDLSEYQNIQPSAAIHNGNLIKGTVAVHSGTQEISVDPSVEGSPMVVVHRNGETIESIEFICGCGKSTSVQFDHNEQ
jgi:hypothetical protein